MLKRFLALFITVAAAAVFMAETDGASYERHGEGACTANVVVAGDSLAERFEPAGFLTGLMGADAAGSAGVGTA